MPKMITSSELAEMVNNGATVRRRPDESVKDLVHTVQALVERIDATGDKGNNAEVVAALKMCADAISAVSAKETPQVFLEPKINVAPAMNPAPVVNISKSPYTFEVERDDRGRIATVRAVPDER